MTIFLLTLIASFLGIIIYCLTLGVWKYIIIGIVIAIIATAIMYLAKYLMEKQEPHKGHYIYNPDKKD